MGRQPAALRTAVAVRRAARRCACGGIVGAGGECAACRARRLQRQASAAGPAAAPPIVHDVLRSPGRPLEPVVRADMEARLGHDFSQVQVHAGASAAESARAVDARAYTVGRHIVFGESGYAPTTGEGRLLLGHELAHVAQQSGHDGVPSRLEVGRVDDPAEAEATRLAAGTIDGHAPIRAGAVRVARQPAGPSAAPGTGGLTDEMLRQIARALRAAMEGLGTDESAIYAAFSGRTQDQVDAIVRVYAQMFRRDLMADLRSELNDDELLRLGSFAPQHPAGAPEAATAAETARLADVVAAQLDEAMRGLGTDESAIYAALTGRSPAERQAIKEAYQRRTHRTLEADLRDELSGSELTRALRLLNQGVLAPEDELYLAMEGLGTDEDTIFRVLEAMAGNSAAITAMETAYREKYGDLIADLRGDLSGEDYARALRVLRPVLQDVAFDDCGRTIIPQVRALIPVGIAKVERAISVLTRGWAGMSVAEKATFNLYFDPSGSGVDDGFVRDVLANFRMIRREFDNDLTVECETGGGPCSLAGRLYYTYFSSIHVCPYFLSETDQTRKERDFVHELTHNALVAVDRPYFLTERAAYNRMTPRGPAAGQIPVFGPLITLISRSDTLNAPDAYAFFAFDV